MDKGLRFFVIAGPNGAGKTTFGKLLIPSNVSIFNGDLILSELVKEYPDIDPEKLKGGVPVALEKARDKALFENKDFAFETNFSSDLSVELIKCFQKEGYKTHLIFFGIDDADFAESRVKTRVQFGGHDVPTETIKFNYQEGMKRVKDGMGIFDSATFISNNLIPTLVAYYQKSPLQYTLLEKEISWFNFYFKIAIEEVVQK